MNIKSALVMGITAAGLAVPATVQPADAASAYTCHTRNDRWGKTFRPSNGPDIYVQYTLMYNYCVAWGSDQSNLPAYVKPRHEIVSYNVEGSRMTCNGFDRFYDGAKSNSYMWRPYTGANFNPGELTVGCDESTINSNDRWFNPSTTPRLYYGPGHGDDRQPRWKVNITAARNFGHGFDMHASHWQKFDPRR
jgi:hypothetical protein